MPLTDAQKKAIAKYRATHIEKCNEIQRNHYKKHREEYTRKRRENALSGKTYSQKMWRLLRKIDVFPLV